MGSRRRAQLRVELDGLLFRDHLFDPDDAWIKGADIVDFPAQLGGDLRRVRRARAQHHLRFAGQVADGVDQMRDALLPGDAADEEHVRNGGIDAVGRAAPWCRVVLVILVRIDAVVDHVNARGVHVGIGAQDVVPGALRDGDDGIGIVDGRGLHPRAHGVAAAELFSLPRAQRFQAVRGQDKRDAEELFRQESGHRNIPRMGVDDVDVRDRNSSAPGSGSWFRERF